MIRRSVRYFSSNYNLSSHFVGSMETTILLRLINKLNSFKLLSSRNEEVSCICFFSCLTLNPWDISLKLCHVKNELMAKRPFRNLTFREVVWKMTSTFRRLFVNRRRRWYWRRFLSFWAWKRGNVKPKFEYSMEYFLRKICATLKPFKTESWWKNFVWFLPRRAHKKIFLFHMMQGFQAVVSCGWFYIIIKQTVLLFFFLFTMINLSQMGYQTVQSVIELPS